MISCEFQNHQVGVFSLTIESFKDYCVRHSTKEVKNTFVRFCKAFSKEVFAANFLHVGHQTARNQYAKHTSDTDICTVHQVIPNR